jgi:hypothetical protein
MCTSDVKTQLISSSTWLTFVNVDLTRTFPVATMRIEDVAASDSGRRFLCNRVHKFGGITVAIHMK